MQSYQHHRDAHPITYLLNQASALTLGSSGTTGSLGEQPPRGVGGMETLEGVVGKPVSHGAGWRGPGPRLVLGQPFVLSGCWLQGGHMLLRSEVLWHCWGLLCLGQ